MRNIYTICLCSCDFRHQTAGYCKYNFTSRSGQLSDVVRAKSSFPVRMTAQPAASGLETAQKAGIYCAVFG
jgi:hypothetical protein